MIFSKITGNKGERKAAIEYKKRGYKIVARNFSCRFGELDIVAAKHNTIVIAEVKTRKNADFAQAREFVDFRKQEKLRTTASFYLSENSTNLQPRFDVIEIYAPEGTQTVSPEIYHMEDAFQ